MPCTLNGIEHHCNCACLTTYEFRVVRELCNCGAIDYKGKAWFGKVIDGERIFEARPARDIA